MDWDAITAALLSGVAETDWSTVIVALLGIVGTVWGTGAADRRAGKRAEVERTHRREEQAEARTHEVEAARRSESEAAARAALERLDELWNPLRDKTPEMSEGYELSFDKDKYRAAERAVGFIHDNPVRDLVSAALAAALDIWHGFQFGHLAGVPYVRQRNAMGSAIAVLQAHIRGDEPPEDARRVIDEISTAVHEGREEHWALLAEDYEAQRETTEAEVTTEPIDEGDAELPSGSDAPKTS